MYIGNVFAEKVKGVEPRHGKRSLQAFRLLGGMILLGLTLPYSKSVAPHLSGAAYESRDKRSERNPFETNG